MAGTRQSPSLRPMLALVAGAVAIGFAPVFVRWSEVGPNATAFWRLALAVPVLWFAARRGGARAMPRQSRGLLLVAGVCFALDLCFWHASIAWTSVANATLLANLTPLVVVLFYWLAFRQRPTLRFSVGALLALAGAAGLALGGLSPDEGSGTGPNRLLGDAFGAITSVWYAGYLLAVERARGQASGPQVMFASTAVAMVVAGIAAALFDASLWPESASGWAVLVGLALLVHVIGQGGIVWALGQLPAPLSSVVILIQPVVAAGLGWLWLGEALGPLDGVCAVLVLAGILLCRRAP